MDWKHQSAIQQSLWLSQMKARTKTLKTTFILFQFYYWSTIMYSLGHNVINSMSLIYIECTALFWYHFRNIMYKYKQFQDPRYEPFLVETFYSENDWGRHKTWVCTLQKKYVQKNTIYISPNHTNAHTHTHIQSKYRIFSNTQLTERNKEYGVVKTTIPIALCPTYQ